jgi:hypothetical protein
MDQKAQKLRACATEARAVARSLGPYLDDAVSKAAPRAVDMAVGFGDAPSGGNDAIWLGPFADQCTSTLQQRRGTLGRMATALMADAARWENEASRLESESKAAKAKDKAKTATGGH